MKAIFVLVASALGLTAALSPEPRDDSKTVIPVTVVSSDPLPVGNAECAVWGIDHNRTAHTFAPVCHKWQADTDASTSDHQILHLETVKLAQKGKTCASWHVEVHDGIVAPTCGNISSQTDSSSDFPAHEHLVIPSDFVGLEPLVATSALREEIAHGAMELPAEQAGKVPSEVWAEVASLLGTSDTLSATPTRATSNGEDVESAPTDRFVTKILPRAAATAAAPVVTSVAKRQEHIGDFLSDILKAPSFDIDMGYNSPPCLPFDEEPWFDKILGNKPTSGMAMATKKPCHILKRASGEDVAGPAPAVVPTVDRRSERFICHLDPCSAVCASKWSQDRCRWQIVSISGPGHKGPRDLSSVGEFGEGVGQVNTAAGYMRLEDLESTDEANQLVESKRDSEDIEYAQNLDSMLNLEDLDDLDTAHGMSLHDYTERELDVAEAHMYDADAMGYNDHLDVTHDLEDFMDMNNAHEETLKDYLERPHDDAESSMEQGDAEDIESSGYIYPDTASDLMDIDDLDKYLDSTADIAEPIAKFDGGDDMGYDEDLVSTDESGDLVLDRLHLGEIPGADDAPPTATTLEARHDTCNLDPCDIRCLAFQTGVECGMKKIDDALDKDKGGKRDGVVDGAAESGAVSEDQSPRVTDLTDRPSMMGLGPETTLPLSHPCYDMCSPRCRAFRTGPDFDFLSHIRYVCPDPPRYASDNSTDPFWKNGDDDEPATDEIIDRRPYFPPHMTCNKMPCSPNCIGKVRGVDCGFRFRKGIASEAERKQTLAIMAAAKKVEEAEKEDEEEEEEEEVKEEELKEEQEVSSWADAGTGP
ncbi:hypothetical protein LTR53_004100 [Teratosphaeriaceae sp. CCFEE 6253]|nr:hypothetical protein LTR53_004100 [Teratosphaeriaceae sp. CCFEE 6253]